MIVKQGFLLTMKGLNKTKKTVALYKRHRYRVIEIPSPDSPDLIRNFEVVNNSVNDRLSIIKKN